MKMMSYKTIDQYIAGFPPETRELLKKIRATIGFYPTSSGITAFKKELAKYETARGTVRFPLDEKIPFGLITRIVKFRVKENKGK